jgi:hypothetical protein
MNKRQLKRAAEILWPRILEIMDYQKGEDPLAFADAANLPEIRIVAENEGIFEHFSHDPLAFPKGYYHRAGEDDGLQFEGAAILLVRVSLETLAHELVHHAQTLLNRFPHHSDDMSEIEYALDESEMEAQWVVRVLQGLEKA